ncbi:polyubiquitin-like [Bidens hawaiensis]|uniref:polyubiquitin-like n=1 Tax=Bidens hawaiensis TaxID=980011 RepID=UPI00404A1B9B
MKLFIRTTTTGKAFPLKVKGSDTFDIVMAKIKVMPHECSNIDNCSCLPSVITKMLLVIRPTTGKTITHDVNGSDTLDLVKAKTRHTYSLDNRDIRWELIPEPVYWEKWWSTLIFVRVVNNGNTITLAVNNCSEIFDLMHLIRCEKGILPFRQTLFFAGTRLDNKACTMEDYNIDEGSTLDLVLMGTKRKPDVFLESTDETDENHWLVLNDRKIKKVKKSIEKMAGVSLERKKLVRPGEELDDNCFLSNYDIHEVTFWLVDDAFMRRSVSMTIYIQLPVTQKTICLNVESTDTIRAVKAMIQSRNGIPRGRQVLFLPYKRLNEDTFTLADYFIPDGSTLYLAQVLGENMFRT